jgi:hypothetical protein
MHYLKRTLEAWPYLLIAISVAGLMYVGLSAAR